MAFTRKKNKQLPQQSTQLTIAGTGPCIYSIKTRRYIDYLTFALEFSDYDSNSDNNSNYDGSQNSQHDSVHWTVVVGDIVAVACSQSKGDTWPFHASWSPAQILAFYKTEKHQRYKMTVRWFYRHEELTKQEQSKLPGELMHQLQNHKHQQTPHCDYYYETNEIQSCSVDTILGKVIIKSTTTSNHFQSTPIPTLQLCCNTHVQTNTKTNTTTIQQAKGWDDYDLYKGILPIAFARGLRHMTDSQLTNAITLAFCGDRLQFRDNTEKHPIPTKRTNSNKTLTDNHVDTVVSSFVEPSALLHCVPHSKSGSRRYYSSASIPIPRAKYSGPRRRISKTHWKLRIGDIVALQHQDSFVASKKTKTCYPFTVSWSYGQVLTIYQHEDQVLLLEIRYFRRIKETSIQPNIIPLLNINGNQDEHIFETNTVDQDIVASRVLAPIHVWFGHHGTTDTAGTPLVASTTASTGVPTIVARCQYTLVQHNRLQPFFCAGLLHKEWVQYCNERGRNVSLLCQNDKELSFAMTFVDPVPSWTMDQLDLSPIPTARLLCGLKEDQDCLSQGGVVPPWSFFLHADLVCHPRYRTNLSWTVSVGDVVACQFPPSQTPAHVPGQQIWYPYTIAWTPCQVMAIVRSNKENMIQFEVRWFRRANELSHVPHEHVNASQRLELDLIYEVHDGDTVIVDECALLGPVTLLSISERCPSSIPIPFMPLNVQLYGGAYSRHAQNFNPVPWSPLESVRRGMPFTKTYAELDKKDILQQFEATLTIHEGPSKRKTHPDMSEPTTKKSRRHSSPEEPLRDVESRVWTTVVPFHQDLSAKRSYYTEINIRPPYENYSDHLIANKVDNPKKAHYWTVKMGDPAIVHWNENIGNGHRNAFFPFKVRWAVGEVTTIWKEHHHNETKPSSIGSLVSNGGDMIKVEIRWFYRNHELTGAMKAPSISRKASLTTREEVLETDHLDITKATSLLAPALLNPTQEQEAEAKNLTGMPVVSFDCRRMWSVHRKSLIPIGSMEGRVQRGRMSSQVLGKNTILRQALDRHFSTCSSPHESVADLGNNKWKIPFQRVIKKLSLIEASEDAYERGVALIGRESQQQTISSFLRNAIAGGNDGGETGTTMLIAGPPGTGKTSTVCSIIADLRKEQADGRLPTFEFISLNGMELRHPFESYVKFWEALSGTKEKKPPEMAVAMLEKYFLGNSKEDDSTCESIGSNPVIVLMLDEIDYLVTKKQTVIYNFFDWPRRTSDSQGGHRLVVVGISNTLNLPSRLKPSVQSRIGNNCCVFKAYNAQSMVDILTTKIQPDPTSYQVFDKDAILFCARKIASTSGDLRKALKTCQSATVTVMKEAEEGTRDDPQSAKDQPTVRIRDIQRVIREAFGSIAAQAITASTPFQALVLVCLGALRKSTGRPEGGFDIKELMTKMDAIASASGEDQYMPPPSVSATLSILTSLAEASLVRLETPKSTATSFRAAQGGSGGAFPLVSIAFDFFLLIPALKGTSHKTLAEKHLGGC